MRIYNTLSRKIEEFVPIKSPHVGMYTCGPTVYFYPHIGNYRMFVFYDLLRRVLEYNEYDVDQVMNATDVGHLTGDNLGDADLGVDRMDKEAKKEGKTVWEVAQFYIDDFKESWELLNILPPAHFVRATDHIKEQIDLAKKLMDKGLAYETETGVFFDVTKFPDYGRLGGQKLVDKRTAAREEVEEDKTKRHPQDFALWLKRVGKFADHQMHWDSPWGDGFPGWHIECSAMAMKYLGETIDIHAGGVDHIAIHHTNEIAQSEGATGKRFAKYWLHGEFLTVDGGRMGKSLGNAYTLHDIVDKGFDPLALRYFYLTAHYRTVLNFTWEALENARNSLTKLEGKVAGLMEEARNDRKTPDDIGCAGYEGEFKEVIGGDLNMPQALAVVWRLVDDSSMPAKARLTSLLRFDKVLGLELNKQPVSRLTSVVFSKALKNLMEEREKLRKEKKFTEADKVREEIEKMGYVIEDTGGGVRIRKVD